MGGQKLFQCPRKLVHRESYEWLQLWQHYQQGFLPFEGGLMDQPGLYLAVMSLITSEIKGGQKS